MKLDLKRIDWEGQWFDFRDGVRLKIRPIPRSRQHWLFTAGGVRFDGNQRADDFKYSLVDVEGLDVIDQTGKPVKLDDGVKQIIFDSNFEGIPDFVLMKTQEIINAMAESEKN